MTQSGARRVSVLLNRTFRLKFRLFRLWTVAPQVHPPTYCVSRRDGWGFAKGTDTSLCRIVFGSTLSVQIDAAMQDVMKTMWRRIGCLHSDSSCSGSPICNRRSWMTTRSESLFGPAFGCWQPRRIIWIFRILDLAYAHATFFSIKIKTRVHYSFSVH